MKKFFLCSTLFLSLFLSTCNKTFSRNSNQLQEASITVCNDPISIAVNAPRGRVYVSCFSDDKVAVIMTSPNMHSLETLINLWGKGPTGIAVNLATSKVYVVHSDMAQVDIIDGLTNMVYKSIGADPDSIYAGIAINPNTNKFYVTDYHFDTLQVHDGSTDMVSLLEQTQTGHGPLGVALDPVSNYIYVANSLDGTLSVINGATNEAVSSVELGFFPGGVAVKGGLESKVYVAKKSTPLVAAIGGAEGTLAYNDVLERKIDYLSDVGKIAIDPTRNRIYVVNSVDESLLVIDGITQRVIESVHVPKILSVGVAQDFNIVYVGVSPNKVRILNLSDD